MHCLSVFSPSPWELVTGPCGHRPPRGDKSFRLVSFLFSKPVLVIGESALGGCPLACFCLTPPDPGPRLQESKPIGSAHNRRSQPFVAAANIDDKRQVVSSSYNSPIGLYSTGNIQDALQGQLRGLVQSKPEGFKAKFGHVLRPPFMSLAECEYKSGRGGWGRLQGLGRDAGVLISSARPTSNPHSSSPVSKLMSLTFDLLTLRGQPCILTITTLSVPSASITNPPSLALTPPSPPCVLQDLGYFEHKFNVRPKPFTPAGQSRSRTLRPPRTLCMKPVSCRARLLIPGSAGSTIFPYSTSRLSSIEDSHVYRMLQESQEETHVPRQSGSFKALQEFVDSDGKRLPFALPDGGTTACSEPRFVVTVPAGLGMMSAKGKRRSVRGGLRRNAFPGYSWNSNQQPDVSRGVASAQVTVPAGTRPLVTRSVKAPVTKPPPPAGTLQKLPLCDKCGNGIVGTVVKVRDKFRHPGCFVCSDCDVNLKQKGYFFVEGQLYCETHARARTRPPEGHDLITTYPNK
ncbi:hypothetical protein Z043_103693 [Scleropages formosus]|uniref:LIM zinc-binding domain-containing protein n=1 Tax=Scleropages formosus TaxID=113540 RepID=A0A0P7V5G4_SCLFO|nr:hypothetical protein Z043_103693 [Scleropages formosus]